MSEPQDKNKISSRVRPSRIRRGVAALLLTTALVGVGGGYAIRGFAAEQPTPPPVNASVMTPSSFAQVGFADLVDKVKPAVVNIATTEKVKRPTPDQMPQFPPDSPFAEMFKFFEQQQEQQSDTPKQALGSGFIVDPSGYVVTNNHVIDKASKITVTLDGGKTYPAKLIGHDEKTDLALLKIDAPQPLPYVAFGDSDQARVGNWVIAVGNPFGLGGTVTAGIVSAHDRDINDGPYGGFLQIDAAINPGNSGGPLFDQAGNVVGIDTAIYSPNGGSVGIGFAIPSNEAKTVIAQIRDHGSVKRGWLGVQMQPLTDTLAKAVGRPNTDGVMIDDVVANSPAQKAKLQQGDVITAFNGKTIKAPSDLARAVANVKAGDAAKMTVWRDNSERTVSVTIGTQAEDKKVADNDTDSRQSAPVGMALEPLSQKAKNALNLKDDAKGVVVARVNPDSKAAESGIRAGDVIVRVANKAVTSPSEAANQIREAQKAKKEAVPLLVMRDGTTYYLALQLANS